MKILWSNAQGLKRTFRKISFVHNGLVSSGYKFCGVFGSNSFSPTCTNVANVHAPMLQPGSFNHFCTSSVRQKGAPGLKSKEDPRTKDYSELYLLQRITFLRVLSRFTKYSSLFFVGGAPMLLAAAQIEAVSWDNAISLSSVLAFYSLLFTCQSIVFSSKVVGKIMISSDEKFLKISHLSIFGARRDIYVSPNDLVPTTRDVFASNITTLRIKNFSKTLFFLPKQGGLDTDYEALEKLLIR